MRDLRSISSIFRRNSKGEYDAAAARDRDILSYPIKTTNNAIAHEDSTRNAKDFTFTRWKLINWLRHNHKPYVKRYEQRPLGSENEEKISLEKTIRRSLERLVELELFQVVQEPAQRLFINTQYLDI